MTPLHDAAVVPDMPVLLGLTGSLSFGLKFGHSRTKLPLWG
jgi:hypothetical protein